MEEEKKGIQKNYLQKFVLVLQFIEICNNTCEIRYLFNKFLTIFCLIFLSFGSGSGSKWSSTPTWLRIRLDADPRHLIYSQLLLQQQYPSMFGGYCNHARSGPDTHQNGQDPDTRGG